MAQPGAFEGFPQEGIDFLHQLAANNERSWFEAHKAIYQRAILDHVPVFVAALGERLKSISPNIEYDTRTNGSGSMMRIYRDVRFSKDKTPYRTSVPIVFWEGPRKKMENLGFGFEFGAEGTGAMAGLFRMADDQLKAFRRDVLDETRGQALVDAIANLHAAGDYKIEGDSTQRVPAGFSADHPRADLLRRKGLYAVAPPIDLATVTNPALVDLLYEQFRIMSRIQQWLVGLERPA